MVEAIRAGLIFAGSKAGQRQYDRWRARVRRRSGRSAGLVGEALERAILGFASRHPEYVVIEGASA